MKDSVFVAFWFNVMAYFTYRNSTLIAIKEIKYFPEKSNRGWCMPPIVILRWFKLAKRKIPAYLLIRLGFTLVFQTLILVSPILCLLVGDNTEGLVNIGIVFFIIVIIENLEWAIFTAIFKRRRR